MMLTRERLIEVLDYDPVTGNFTWKKQLAPRGKIGSRAGSVSKGGRIDIRIDGKLYLAHRLAWLYVHGEWPKDEIDHQNVDPSVNQFDNLREATRHQNMCNTRKHKDNTSGIKGVCFDRQRQLWSASICVNYRHHFLGRFADKSDAAKAYAVAADRMHGEFARAR